ncbi:putative FCP1 domain-containing protein [Ceratocystis fimbriata CBS 114723]|uniref:Mitochondrial import inner membrane translocase subunit TIM50 n=1 Tax=Ceratocystis fimbriata CBS 114723 TaxID=1035309 RepID=A0A2C5XJF6_9PEZI|nr:putative FCP1 domain-containing protein [Ceratocystis fimbriata CBS 114723]
MHTFRNRLVNRSLASFAFPPLVTQPPYRTRRLSTSTIEFPISSTKTQFQSETQHKLPKSSLKTPTVFSSDSQPSLRLLTNSLTETDRQRYKSAFIPKPKLKGGQHTPPSFSRMPQNNSQNSSTQSSKKKKKTPLDLPSKPTSPPPQKAVGKAYSIPSKESGGVPEPTVGYLAQASLDLQPLTSPRPILIILDLNGTLLWRPHRRNPTTFIERQHTRLFLNYLVNNFVVAVWSSAQPDNVRHMVNHLFPTTERQQLAAVWGRDRFGLSEKDYFNRVQVYKRLTLLWDNPAVQESSIDGKPWDQTNTVLVDDSTEKARSEPYNSITIPEFVGQTETSHVLPQVHDYLNTLAFQGNISAYIRKHPFKQDVNFVL